MHPASPAVRRAAGPRRLFTATLVIGLLAAAVLPASASTESARYRFEGNKWLSLDLTVAEVRADVIRFEWPSTLMGVKTGYKATLKLTNGSTQQVSIGLAVILYAADGRPIGAGTSGTKLGTIDPGDSAEFKIDFNHVTERIEQSSEFHLVLETR